MESLLPSDRLSDLIVRRLQSSAGTAFACNDDHKRAHFTPVFVLVGQAIFEGDVRYDAAQVHDAARQRQRRALADAVASQCGTMDRPKAPISLSLIVLISHQSIGGSYEG